MAAIIFYFQKGIDVINVETAFDIRITEVRGLFPSQPKELFTRDWAAEHGLDVYIPASRKRKSSEVTITGYAEGSVTAPPLARFEQLCAYLFDGETIYWDTLRNRKVTLVYDSSKPLFETYIPQQEKALFQLTMINYSGLVETV